MNSIYLRRRQKIFIKKENNVLSKDYLSTILKNIESLGYTLSKEVFEILKTYNEEQAIIFYKSIITNLKQMLGDNVLYNPMYPNFPEQVMKSDDIELYLNAIVHYITNGQLLPQYKKEERFSLSNNLKKLKIIDIGTEEEFNTIFKNLLNSKTSISELDKKDLEWYVKNNSNKIKVILPNEIPLKENIALFSKLLIKYIDKPEKFLFRYYKTATDVLRFAVSLSEGDISLKEKPIFKKFKRKERRLLLGLLENCNNIEEDMVRYKTQWIRLGEIIHPFEYKNRYKKVYESFYKIRNDIKIHTFNSKVNNYINNKQYTKAIHLLSTRAGDFARKLDYMLRIVDDKNKVINAFKDVAYNVSSTVLLQVMCHFKHRNDKKDIRSFIPKGNVSNIYCIDNNLDDIDEKICKYIIKICKNNLIIKYATNKDILGKVYIDEELKKYTIPLSQRSASKSLNTISRGSIIDIDKDTKILRPFIYWKDGKYTTDIDLSVVLYDKEWNYINDISYMNLKDKHNGVCHSGDIVSAPNGASEFIDLNLNKMKENNINYAIISINSYSEQPYCDLPICYMGWMDRRNDMTGEIYEPNTVKQKLDLTANSIIAIPLIINIENNQIIWTDLSLNRNLSYQNNVRNNKKGMALLGKSMVNLKKPNLYDLFKLHADARGFIVQNKEEADIVYSIDGDIKPTDIDIIVGEYL